MKLELDLVEVNRDAKPPVCKLMNYSREKYRKQVQEKERAKQKAAGSLKKAATKEVRISAKTELKDLKIKVDAIKRLMERGYRVKCTLTGREAQDFSGLMSQLCELIEDVALVEFGPKFQSKQAHLIVRHIKFGTGKKGGKKDKTVASPNIENADSAHVDSHGEEQHDQESGSDDDDEVEAPSQSVTAVSSEDNFYSDMKGNSFVAKPTASTILQETENKYARNAPKNASAVRNPTRTLDSATQILGQPYAIPQPHHSVPPRNGEVEAPTRSVAAISDPSQSFNSDMKGANFIASPTASATSQGTENRYARSAPNNASAVRNPVRTLDNAPQISGQPFAHPYNWVPPCNFPQQNHPSVPPPNSHQQGVRQGSPPRNLPFPPYDIRQPRGETPTQSTQANSNMSGSTGHRQPPGNADGLASHSTVFGIFSNKKAENINPNSARSSDATRISGPVVAPDNLNPPTSKSDGRQETESSQKKFGIFSR
ncbi:translation initiation factor IF3-1, mitochondrial isoform X2 [Amaranthus tricolor]|nr:translation initiation factor IF3-1, mitochondrial isoform X2 [Amaranthus tricolor]